MVLEKGNSVIFPINSIYTANSSINVMRTGNSGKLSASRLLLGNYTVKLRNAEGCADTSFNVKIGFNTNTDISVNLIPLFGSIKINSSPQGYSIYVNGIKKGKTPAVIDKIPAKSASVVLKEKNMSVYESNIYIKANDIIDLGIVDIPTGMALIPGGTFMMGSNEGNDWQKPVHQVTVSGFWMDKHEVTQAEYERVMGTNPSGYNGCPNCPVEKVSWNDAVDFCTKVGKRLPTEAEWEYAARAGSTTKYYWGNDMNGDYAWYPGNSDSKTHPVGQKRPNAWGLHDMSGNVWEWCTDWFANYSAEFETNPTGPATGANRVVRGGSFYPLNDGSDGLVSAFRNGWSPDIKYSNLGFRCARSK
jgi:hypothetical protein